MNRRSFTALLLALCLMLGLSATAAQFDSSQTIAVVSREEGSGTRGAFIELVGLTGKDADGKTMDLTYAEADFVNGTNLVLTTVASNEYAIGYASLSSVLQDDTVKALTIGGVQASAEQIVAKAYPIARPFNVVTKGELENEIAKDFMAFVMSRQGQDIVAGDGLVRADDAAADYVARDLSGKLTVGGSTSVSPVIELLKEAYSELNPQVEIDVQSTGSSAGVTGALDGTYDVGMASRELKASEMEAGAQFIVIGLDGIAIVVNPANPLSDLSMAQLRSIFLGETTVWADANK